MTSEIILPRKDEQGLQYISYSQYNSYKDEKSFSLGILGQHEYIIGYFLGVRFPDQGWGTFGGDAEDYICTREKADTFDDREKAVMNTIEPLGIFQHEVKLRLIDGVYLLGYIDDMKPDWKKIRDYKTCSKASSQKYYKPEYYQIDIYSAYVKQEKGFIPEAEVCMIERKGNCFGMVDRRDLLSVGNEVWYHLREVTQERIDYITGDIIRVVHEISDLYKVFLKVNV